jgi:hypothetical protein
MGRILNSQTAPKPTSARATHHQWLARVAGRGWRRKRFPREPALRRIKFRRQSIGKTCGEMWQPRAVAESTSSVSPGLRENRNEGMEPIMRIVMASNETPARAMNIHQGVGWESSFDPSTAEIIRCDEANRRTPRLRPPAQ